MHLLMTLLVTLAPVPTCQQVELEIRKSEWSLKQKENEILRFLEKEPRQSARFRWDMERHLQEHAAISQSIGKGNALLQSGTCTK